MSVTRSVSKATEIIIVGGGAAGLAAAVALGRSRRKVTLIDAGEPRNAPAQHAHNVLGQEGVNPLDLLARGRAEAKGYGVDVRHGLVTAARRENNRSFTVESSTGTFTARRIILATGLVDVLPEIPGLSSGWGKDVLHCPYCHGWEVRDSRIVVLGTSPMSIHQALLFSQLSDQVTFVIHDLAAQPDATAAKRLANVGVDVIKGKVSQVERDGSGVRLVFGDTPKSLDCDNLVVAPLFQPRTNLYEQLGGVPKDVPAMQAQMIPVDPPGRTPVDGVWAIGNSVDMAKMVVGAASDGVLAAAQINMELIMEDASR